MSQRRSLARLAEAAYATEVTLRAELKRDQARPTWLTEMQSSKAWRAKLERLIPKAEARVARRLRTFQGAAQPQGE